MSDNDEQLHRRFWIREMALDFAAAAFAIIAAVSIAAVPAYLDARGTCASKCGDSFRFAFTMNGQSCVCVVHP